MAAMMSVDLSMTITAAVPMPDLSLDSVSKSSVRSWQMVGRQARHRRAAGDHGQQVVPAAAHAAGMALEQLAQGDAHLLFDHAGLLDVAGDLEQLGAGVVGLADAGEPGRAAAQDVAGATAMDFDVVDGGRRAVEAGVGGERRLQARLALLALEAFQQRGLLAADVGAGAVVHDKVEVPAVDVVLADQLGRRRPPRRPPPDARARG